MRDRRSYVEVLGLSSQPTLDSFNTFSEPVAKVPMWLKDASAEMDRQAKKKGKTPMMPIQKQMTTGGGIAEKGGCYLKDGAIPSERFRAPVKNSLS